MLDWLGRAKKFIQLDLTNAFYQMRTHKSNKWKTAFQIQYGYFKYQVMLFSWSNTLATFQGYIIKILVEKLDIFVIIYLDDILIYNKNLREPHVEVVHWVFD